MGSVIGFVFIFLCIKSLHTILRALRNEGAKGMKNNSNGLLIGSIICFACGLWPLGIAGIIMHTSAKKHSSEKRNTSNSTSPYYTKNPYMNLNATQNPYQSANGIFTSATPQARTVQRQGNAYYTGYASTNTKSSASYSPQSFGLPSSTRKRRRIVEKFNERYELSLSRVDIDRIVDASYLSTDWAREICYMNQKYETIYSWYATVNPWLKVYLYVFQVQNISSDFAMQERIAFDAFDQVFSDACADPNVPLDVVIQRINEKYFTNFDETTFMIAYRYMESKGKRYTISFNPVINGQADIDDLLKKYEQLNQPTPSQ